MKLLTALALTTALASCNALSDRPRWTDYGDDPMQNPQYMEDTTAAGTPGPQHTALAELAGSWKVTGKMWMAPDTEPMPMTATVRIEAVLGGRSTVETFKSDFMGMPYEGRLTQGFDNVSQKYWSLWTDSMSTGYWLSHGTETAPGRIEMVGMANDVLTPKGRPVRMVVTQNGDGSHTMRMYDTNKSGAEFQSMELHYVRG